MKIRCLVSLFLDHYQIFIINIEQDLNYHLLIFSIDIRIIDKMNPNTIDWNWNPGITVELDEPLSV